MEENKSEYEATSNSYRKAPKIAQKMLLTKAVEKSRTKLQEITSMQENGDYTTAPDTGSTVTDTTYSMVKETTDFTVQQVRKFTRKQIQKYRERRTTERAETTCAHTASECGVSPKQAGHGTLPDAEQRPRCGADLPRQRAKEKAVTAKTVPRDIRGVTQRQRQLRTAENETVRSVTTQAQMHTRTRQVQFAIQKAASNTRRTVTAVRSAIRHFLASLHSLVAAIAVGISVALSIIIVISLVAFVSGSAYGIFFAANAPGADTITVQEAVETLTAEYRDRLEEISDTVQHDRQDITANDDVYYIRWQDVLAVFSSYVVCGRQRTRRTRCGADRGTGGQAAGNYVGNERSGLRYPCGNRCYRNNGQKRKSDHNRDNRNRPRNRTHPQNARRDGGRLPFYRPPKHIPATPARPAV